ncbi:hypothetical protein EVAR_11269_1 [Eumeta japonica]|uniref:Uncharacterized protein n=1 Tax=Eumeta variegata TaxID=151549 RepID=A0A4C1UMD8_EUMVA|nr:hypothetical protein EVAR_11269_1 [Eumeta japonica]
MYGSEGWAWQKKNESKINALEMRSLRSMCGVSRKDRCRNSDVRARCGLKDDVVTGVERAGARSSAHRDTWTKLFPLSLSIYIDNDICLFFFATNIGPPSRLLDDHVHSRCQCNARNSAAMNCLRKMMNAQGIASFLYRHHTCIELDD